MSFFDPQPDRTQVWSFGGGVQSTALAALIIQGRLPKPDLAVMVDTTREKTAVLTYAREITGPALAQVGVLLHVVSTTDFATVDLTSKNGKHILIPGFTDITGAEVGKFSNFCSGKWKREVIDRWLRRVHQVKACDRWIGISIDEMRRVRQPRQLWARNLYPLIELRLRREGCLRIVQEMGWPPPPRSSCWMCPNQSNAEWLDLKENHPEDFAKAVDLDLFIRQTDPHFWLHESCAPLDEVDFTAPPNLFTDKACDSGFCMN